MRAPSRSRGRAAARGDASRFSCSPKAMQSRFTIPATWSSSPRSFASSSVVARPGELDLLGGKRDQADAALEVAAGERGADAAHALDARRVVDRARAAPHRVVVRADDDVLAAAAGYVRDHVAFQPAGQKAAADPEAHPHPVQQPLGVGARDERGRRGRDVGMRRHERDRTGRERARQEPRAFSPRRIDEREVRQEAVADRRAARRRSVAPCPHRRSRASTCTARRPSARPRPRAAARRRCSRAAGTPGTARRGRAPETRRQPGRRPAPRRRYRPCAGRSGLRAPRRDS